MNSREIVMALIGEMQLKAARAQADGDRFTAELCALTMESVLPMVRELRPPLIGSGKS